MGKRSKSRSRGIRDGETREDRETGLTVSETRSKEEQGITRDLHRFADRGDLDGRGRSEAEFFLLQKQQGNNHVQRMVRRSGISQGLVGKRSVISPGEVAGDLLQRVNGGPEESVQRPEDMRLDISTVELRALLEYPIHVTNPATMNMSAVRLMGRLRQAGRQSSDLRGELGYLRYAGETTGPQTLEEFRGIRGELGQRARGRRGQYLREAIERYTGANNSVRAHLPDVRAKQQAVRTAAAELRTAVLEGQILEAEREEEEARGQIAEVEGRIARAKEIAGGVIGPASDLLQGKWQEAGIDLAKFIGQEIVNAGIDAAYAPELRRAQAQLREAEEKLDTFQDERQAANLEAKANNLQSKNSEAEAAQLSLMTVVWQAEEAHTTLREELERMGETEAAEGLDARASTMQASARTLRGLMEYQESVRGIKNHSERLGDVNRGLASLMVSPGGPNYVANEDHRHEIFEAADHNATELERVTTWAENELTVVGSTRQFIEGGSFLEAYDEIDTALHEAVIWR